MTNTNTTPPDAQEIGGILDRINLLGTATAQVFSRLYKGLGQRSGLQAEMERNRLLLRQKQLLQQALHRRNEESERLNSILGSITEGVIMQDTEGRIVLMNAAAHQLVGNHKNIWDSELGSLFEAYREIDSVDAEIMPLGEPTSIEINNRVLGAQIAAVADSQGERLGTLIVLRDVTREALSERLKEQFVTAISHELRTPMTVIKHVSELMAGQTDQPPNRRFLEMLTRNVDILDRMIVELLDISEMSSGSFGVRHAEIDLEALVWNVVKGMQPEINRHQLDVSVMTRKNNLLKVMGDEQRLRWALGHLLQNGIRYTEPKGHIIIIAGPTDDRQIAIQVVDTGVGVSERDMPHIFERFYRGKPRTKDGKLLDPRGLGQGLFVARSVAEAHGGRLTVRSQEGQGSIFTMFLPIARLGNAATNNH